VANLYTWLRFLHLIGLVAFLIGHGISAGASFVLRRPLSDTARAAVLMVSIRAYAGAGPGLLLLVVTGVWMGFLGSWWRTGWIWTSIVVFVAVIVAMSAQSVPYHKARDAAAKNPMGEIESELKRARPEVLAAVGTVALVILVFLMVFKPF
jgi:uncharacterized membrane protein